MSLFAAIITGMTGIAAKVGYMSKLLLAEASGNDGEITHRARSVTFIRLDLSRYFLILASASSFCTLDVVL